MYLFIYFLSIFEISTLYYKNNYYVIFWSHIYDKNGYKLLGSRKKGSLSRYTKNIPLKYIIINDKLMPLLCMMEVTTNRINSR